MSHQCDDDVRFDKKLSLSQHFEIPSVDKNLIKPTRNPAKYRRISHVYSSQPGSVVARMFRRRVDPPTKAVNTYPKRDVGGFNLSRWVVTKLPGSIANIRSEGFSTGACTLSTVTDRTRGCICTACILAFCCKSAVDATLPVGKAASGVATSICDVAIVWRARLLLPTEDVPSSLRVVGMWRTSA